MLFEIHRAEDGSIPALKLIAETPEDMQTLADMLSKTEPVSEPVPEPEPEAIAEAEPEQQSEVQ